jgi:anti-sigma regulatory factor (Ser/Thr protein kinase)
MRGHRTDTGGMSNIAATIPQARIFDGSPEEVRSVRNFVGRLVDGCPVADDIILLASELAANAVVHTASGRDGTFSVVVRADDTWTRVEVHDLGSDVVPAVRRAGSPEESGAGLGLVEMLADRWGFDGGPSGRVVWFEVDWR